MSEHRILLVIRNNPALTYLYCYNNAISLINPYKTSITNKLFRLQNLPDSTVFVNTSIAIDTVFYGVNTPFQIGGSYTLNNGKITFHAPGNYTVQISNPAILDGMVQQKFTVTNPSGIEDIAAPNVKIFPNPFTNVVRIIGVVETGRAPSLRVTNVTGVTVHTQIITGNDETLRLGHLPAGLYFFRLETEGNIKTVKVVKN